MAAREGTIVSAERELVEQQISAAFSRNYAGLAECYAKDVRYVDPGGELTGVDAVLAHTKEVFDPFPGMRFDVAAIYDGDGWAIAEGVVSGKNTGPLVMPDGSNAPCYRARHRTQNGGRIRATRWRDHCGAKLLGQHGYLRAAWPFA